MLQNGSNNTLSALNIRDSMVLGEVKADVV
jgi:hypothetical protein